MTVMATRCLRRPRPRWRTTLPVRLVRILPGADRGCSAPIRAASFRYTRPGAALSGGWASASASPPGGPTPPPRLRRSWPRRRRPAPSPAAPRPWPRCPGVRGRQVAVDLAAPPLGVAGLPDPLGRAHRVSSADRVPGHVPDVGAPPDARSRLRARRSASGSAPPPRRWARTRVCWLASCSASRSLNVAARAAKNVSCAARNRVHSCSSASWSPAGNLPPPISALSRLAVGPTRSSRPATRPRPPAPPCGPGRPRCSSARQVAAAAAGNVSRGGEALPQLSSAFR